MESSVLETLKLRHKYEAILFDLDGTLLGANNFALGVDFVRKFVRFHRPFLGKLKSIQFLHSLRSAIEKGKSTETNFDRGLKIAAQFYGTDSKRADRVLHRALRKIFYAMKSHFFPMKGAKELVDWARTKYPLYLATNPVWPLEFVELRLKWAGIPPQWFKGITHSRRMHSCKPDVDYYTEFLKQEQLTANHCLHIGNDFHKDLIARRVGLSVFILHESQTTLKAIRVPRPISVKGPAWSGNIEVCRDFLVNIPESS